MPLAQLGTWQSCWCMFLCRWRSILGDIRRAFLKDDLSLQLCLVDWLLSSPPWCLPRSELETLGLEGSLQADWVLPASLYWFSLKDNRLEGTIPNNWSLTKSYTGKEGRQGRASSACAACLVG